MLILVLLSGPLILATTTVVQSLLSVPEEARALFQGLIVAISVGAGLLALCLVAVAAIRVPGELAVFVVVWLIPCFLIGLSWMMLAAFEELGADDDSMIQDGWQTAIAWLMTCVGFGGIVGGLLRRASDE